MREKILILMSSIRKNMEVIDGLFEEFKKVYKDYEKTGDHYRLIASGFFLAQIYNGFEKIFEEVARVFENQLEEEYWHSSLLKRMAMSIEGIRPNLISEESYTYLSDLKSFRHFFRHAYNAKIDPRKFEIVASSAERLSKVYKTPVAKPHFFQGIEIQRRQCGSEVGIMESLCSAHVCWFWI